MAMNLGDEMLREVSANRAEIVRRGSPQRSIAASDDFYSLSERGVSPASSDEANTVIRHGSPEAEPYPVSPLLPTRGSTPPPAQQQQQQQQQHQNQRHAVATQDQSSDIFYPSRSTPSPAPSNSMHASMVPEPLHTSRSRQVSGSSRREEPESGVATPRPSTMVRANSDSRPDTARTVTHDDFPMPPRPSPAARRQADNRESQHGNLVFPTAFAAGGARMANSLQIYNDDYDGDDFRPGPGQSQSQSLGTATVGQTQTQPQYRYTLTPAQRGNSWSWRTSKAGNPVPTPGVDPTPELHFAIDQITRDEELAGYGRDSVVPTRDSLAAAPQRMPSSRYSDHGSPPHVDRNAPRTSEAVSRGSGTSDTPFIVAQVPPPLSPQFAAASPPFAPVPVARHRESVSHRYTPASQEDYVDLNKARAVPQVLRYRSMAGILLLCVFMLTTLTIVSVHSALSGGLNRYDGTGTSLYFVYRYLPQLVAAVIIVWMHEVQAGVQRILPFTLLAPPHKKPRPDDVLQTTRRFKSSYLLPDLSPFQDGEFGLGICNIIFWLALFTVPLAAAVFTPTYYTSSAASYWRWTAVQAVCWTLLPIYLLSTIALIFVAIRFNARPTALRWDPQSLADLFVLLRRGNTTLSRYSPAGGGKFAGYPDTRPVSFGLWRSPTNIEGVSHGIGVDTQIVGGVYSPPPPFRASMDPSDPNSPQPVSHFESWQTEQGLRYTWLPWFLRPSPVALWISIAIVLLVAFLVVSWVHHAVQVGFNPLLFAGVKTAVHFSAANFLYSFLPALLGLLCYLLWQPIDNTYRALQPFASMQRPDTESVEGGARPEKSVLLDYNAKLPFAVSIAALANGHYRVAWLSFVTPLSIVLAVLGGGVFQAQYVVGTVDTIHEIASIPGYVALNVFAIVYALSYLAIWPSKAHRLPHNIATVADVADFVIGGKMLNDVVWKDPISKPVLVSDLMAERKFTGEKKMGSGRGNFRLGEHLGLDGKRRQGIYRSE